MGTGGAALVPYVNAFFGDPIVVVPDRAGVWQADTAIVIVIPFIIEGTAGMSDGDTTGQEVVEIVSRRAGHARWRRRKLYALIDVGFVVRSFRTIAELVLHAITEVRVEVVSGRTLRSAGGFFFDYGELKLLVSGYSQFVLDLQYEGIGSRDFESALDQEFKTGVVSFDRKSFGDFSVIKFSLDCARAIPVDGHYFLEEPAFHGGLQKTVALEFRILLLRIIFGDKTDLLCRGEARVKNRGKHEAPLSLELG